MREATRETIPNKIELAPDARPLSAPHFLDPDRITVFYFPALTSRCSRGRAMRPPPPSPRSATQPTPDPAPRLAGWTGAIGDWRSRPRLRGLKRGRGLAAQPHSGPRRVLNAAPAVSWSRRRSWARSLSWPDAASSVPQRAVVSQRLASAREWGPGQVRSSPGRGHS